MKAMYLAKVKMVAAVAAAVIVTGTTVPVGIALAQAAKKEVANGAWVDKAEVEKKAKKDGLNFVIKELSPADALDLISKVSGIPIKRPDVLKSAPPLTFSFLGMSALHAIDHVARFSDPELYYAVTAEGIDVAVRPLCDPAKVTIPEVDFRQASLYDVLSMLHEASAAYGEPHTKALPMQLLVNNKDGKLVGFIFSEIPFSAEHRKQVDAEIANTEFPTVTFTARSISVLKALESVAQITGMGLLIKDGMAIISPKTELTVTNTVMEIEWELTKTRTDADGSRVFVLSVTSGKPPKIQTYSRKLGEEIEGFRLVKFEKKALPSSTTPMYGYVLTLQKGDTQLPLWLTMKSQKQPASTPSHTAKREASIPNRE